MLVEGARARALTVVNPPPHTHCDLCVPPRSQRTPPAPRGCVVFKLHSRTIRLVPGARARNNKRGTHGTTNGRPSHTPSLVEKCMGTQVIPFGSVFVRTVGSPGASRTDAMTSR